MLFSYQGLNDWSGFGLCKTESLSDLLPLLYCPGVLFTLLHYYYTKNDNSGFPKFSP